jgi:transcriptional regulator with XRE-family HTH domain
MNKENNRIIADYDPFFEAASIGQLLQYVRVKRGFTLKHIADKTKIHVGILTNLEKNNLKDLPCKTYVKGFVKALAVCLGIEIKNALGLLETAYDELSIQNAPFEVIPVKSDNFIIQKMSDFKIPTKIPDISRHNMAGLMFLALGITSIGVGFSFSGNNNLSANIEEKMPIVKMVIAPVAPVQSMSIEDKVTMPESSYPRIVGIKFPKTIDSVTPISHL